jgi:hypothetical protein
VTATKPLRDAAFVCEVGAILTLNVAMVGTPGVAYGQTLATGTPQQTSPDVGTVAPVRPLDVPNPTPATGFRYLNGALEIAPQLSLISLYSTNVLETPPPAQGDLGLVVAPALNIKYDKGIYGGSFVASGRYTDYVLFDTVEKKEYLLNPSIYGKLNDQWTVNASYSNSMQAVSNGSLGSTLAALNTIATQQYKGGLNYDNGPIFAEMSIQRKDRQTFAQQIGSEATSTLYEFNDYDVINKVGYNFNSTDKIYALFSLDRTIYTRSDAFDRNSIGDLVALGYAYALNPAVKLTGQIGYLSQDYADRRFAIVNSPIGFVKLNWQLDETWSTEASVSRLASELVFAGTPGIFVDTYDVALRKQYDPKTLLEARVQWIVQQAIQLPIVYKELSLSLGGQYLWDEHTTVECGYKFNIQHTSDNSQNFVEHVVGAGVTYKF